MPRHPLNIMCRQWLLVCTGAVAKSKKGDDNVEQEQLELIVRARYDSDALVILFEQYHGLVNKIIRRFYLAGMSREDWTAEAMQVMHQTCFKFDGTHGSQFGSYYRMILNKHYLSMMRDARAKKREGQMRTLPFGDAQDEMNLGKGINEMGYSFDEYVHSRILIPIFLKQLSAKELGAVRDWVAGTEEHGRSNARARERVRAKWAKFMADEG